jgi:hypothetical protein
MITGLKNDLYLRTIGTLSLPDVPDLVNEIAGLSGSEPEIRARLKTPDWRSRNEGVALAVADGSKAWVSELIGTIEPPTGRSITHALAAAVALADGSLSDSDLARVRGFTREAFDGEVGWAVDKLLFHAGHSTEDPGGPGPYTGYNFEDLLALFRAVIFRKGIPPLVD